MSNLTEIMVILDRSGSMISAKNDHEGGLKSFVEDQKQLDGDVNFTLIQFDSQDKCEIVYDHVDIQNVDKIELTPRGGTPLLDAIGLAVSHLKTKIVDKPDQTIIMVITDGEENDSTEFTNEQIKQLIADYEKNHQWKFLYLGANVDEFSEAGKMGFNVATSAGFTNNTRGVKATYDKLSEKMSWARGMSQTGCALNEVYTAYNFSAEDRSDMKN